MQNIKRENYISDEVVVKRTNEAVRIELEKKAMEIPVVIYDKKSSSYIGKAAMERELK